MMKRMLALESLASCALKRIVEAAWSMWRIIPYCVVTELSLLAEARDQAPRLCLLLSCSRLVVHLNTSRHHVAAAFAPAYSLTTPYPLALHAWVRQSTSSLRCVCRPCDTHGTVQCSVSRPRSSTQKTTLTWSYSTPSDAPVAPDATAPNLDETPDTSSHASSPPPSTPKTRGTRADRDRPRRSTAPSPPRSIVPSHLATSTRDQAAAQRTNALQPFSQTAHLSEPGFP